MFENLKTRLFSKYNWSLLESFEKLIVAHANERDTLRKVLNDEDVNAKEIGKIINPNKCSAYRWLNGEAKIILGDTKPWKDFIKADNNYHAVLRTIINSYKSGGEKAATKLQTQTLPKTVRVMRQAIAEAIKLGIEKSQDDDTSIEQKEYAMLALTVERHFSSTMVSHVRSRALLTRYLDGEVINEDEIKKLKNVCDCELGKLLYGHLQDFYADVPEWQDIITSHRRYHEIVNELFVLNEQGKNVKIHQIQSDILPKIVNDMRAQSMELFKVVKKIEAELY